MRKHFEPGNQVRYYNPARGAQKYKIGVFVREVKKRTLVKKLLSPTYCIVRFSGNTGTTKVPLKGLEHYGN